MLKLIITKFWPVLIPVVIYIIWQFFILPNIKTKKEKKQANALYLLAISTITALIISLLLFFFSENNNNAQKKYTPAHIEGDKIIPAKIK